MISKDIENMFLVVVTVAAIKLTWKAIKGVSKLCLNL